MFHANTERLVAYWRACKGGGFLPSRAGIDPSAFSDLMPQVFMVGRPGAGEYQVRLSGGFVADLHGRELKGEAFLPLWARGDRTRVQAALELACRYPHPIVVSAEIRAFGVPYAPMEVLLAPLAGRGGEADRFIGLYQPTASLGRLGGRVAQELGVVDISNETAVKAPPIRLAALDGRLIA